VIRITGLFMTVLWSRYLQCLYFFLRRREPGAGDEVEADVSQPGGAEISDQRANAPRLWASGNLGSGYAGLGDFRARDFSGTSRVSNVRAPKTNSPGRAEPPSRKRGLCPA